jgi:hypothetical protein
MDQSLKQDYETTTVDLKSKVPDDVKALILCNSDTLTETQKFHLDQYLMRGGGVIVMADGTDPMNMGGMGGMGGRSSPFMRTAAEKLPADLFSHYGFKINKDLVLDRVCLKVPVRVQGLPFPLQVAYQPRWSRSATTSTSPPGLGALQGPRVPLGLVDRARPEAGREGLPAHQVERAREEARGLHRRLVRQAAGRQDGHVRPGDLHAAVPARGAARREVPVLLRGPRGPEGDRRGQAGRERAGQSRRRERRHPLRRPRRADPAERRRRRACEGAPAREEVAGRPAPGDDALQDGAPAPQDGKPAAAPAPAPADAAPKKEFEYLKQSTADGKIFVFGTSGFVEDDFVGGDLANDLFLQNIVDYMAAESLSTLRAKRIDDGQFDEPTAGAQLTAKALGWFATPRS